MKNIAKCVKCGDIIESKSVHDFVRCSCGAIAVDGGDEYIKRSGDMCDFDLEFDRANNIYINEPDPETEAEAVSDSTTDTCQDIVDIVNDLNNACHKLKEQAMPGLSGLTMCIDNVEIKVNII